MLKQNAETGSRRAQASRGKRRPTAVSRVDVNSRLSVCIEPVFPELPVEDRIRAVADAGIQGVEFWGWRDKDVKKIRRALQDTGSRVVLFSGQRAGSLLAPDQLEVYKREIAEAVAVARELECEHLMLLAQEIGEDGAAVHPFSEDSLVLGLRAAKALETVASLGDAYGVTFHLEPLNSVVDHRGYWLDRLSWAVELVKFVDSPRLRVLCDVYHTQVMEGNLLRTIEENLAWIGHFHVADVPGRGEPGTGEIHYPALARLLESLDYRGWIGLECFPKGDSREAIRQFQRAFSA